MGKFGIRTTPACDGEPVAVSTQKPGNVALFVAVSQHGSGVVGLDKQAFKVYENGVALDSEQIKLTLLPTANAATQRVAETIPAGLKSASRLRLTRDGRYALVAGEEMSYVAVLDVSARKVLKKIPVGTGPWGVTVVKRSAAAR